MVGKNRFCLLSLLFICVPICAKIENVTTRSQLTKILLTQPAVIKFSSKNCGPCRASKAMFERLSNNYSNITFIEVDVDKGNPVAIAYGIKGIPAFVFVKNGKVVDSVLGYSGKETENNITKKLDKLVEKQKEDQ